MNADGKEGWLPSNVLQILTDNNNASGERTPSPSNKVSSDENQSSDDDGEWVLLIVSEVANQILFFLCSLRTQTILDTQLSNASQC